VVPAGDPERGKELVKTLGCTSCHEGLGHEPEPSGPSLQSIFAADWGADGCVSPGRSGGRAPDLGLDGDTSALRAFRSVGDPGALFRHAAVEFAERQIRATRCTACHAYDDLPDLWSTRVTETHDLHQDHAPEDGEGKVSQIRPTLTWLGEKLHGRWLAEFISGELPALRPWLDARMPAFPTRGPLMAHGISHAHGFPVTEAPPAAPDPALVEPGEFLIKKDGFGCTACHGIHDQKPYATFEFAAPNFELSYKRLRHEYYTRWMWNPTRVEFRYRMPIYANPQDNESLQDEVLDGVADRQFEAMWQYLQTLSN